MSGSARSPAPAGSAVHALRRIALVEGVSFLVLLGIAMPLRYLAGLPVAVTIVGWIHGVLFIVFCLALARVWRTEAWPRARVALVLVAALLPFGPFVIDARMRGWAGAINAPA